MLAFLLEVSPERHDCLVFSQERSSRYHLNAVSYLEAGARHHDAFSQLWRVSRSSAERIKLSTSPSHPTWAPAARTASRASRSPKPRFRRPRKVCAATFGLAGVWRSAVRGPVCVPETEAARSARADSPALGSSADRTVTPRDGRLAESSAKRVEGVARQVVGARQGMARPRGFRRHHRCRRQFDSSSGFGDANDTPRGPP